jgi:hypothetical protein
MREVPCIVGREQNYPRTNNVSTSLAIFHRSGRLNSADDLIDFFEGDMTINGESYQIFERYGLTITQAIEETSKICQDKIKWNIEPMGYHFMRGSGMGFSASVEVPDGESK